MPLPLRARIAEVAAEVELLRARGGRNDAAAIADKVPEVCSAALSPRQQRVLILLKGGRTYADVVRAMGISPRTVAKHASAIYQRLNVENRYAASLTLRRRSEP